MSNQNEINSKIAGNLRRLRLERGYTLQQLGDVLEVSNQQYSLIELGRSRVYASQLVVIALFYAVDISTFLD